MIVKDAVEKLNELNAIEAEVGIALNEISNGEGRAAEVLEAELSRVRTARYELLRRGVVDIACEQD